MTVQLLLCKDYTAFNHNIILIDEKTKLSSLGLSKAIVAEAENFFADKVGNIFQQQYESRSLSIVKIDATKEEFKIQEASRKAGNALNKFLNSKQVKEPLLLQKAPR